MKKLLLLITFVSLQSFAEEIPGDTLLKYFSANCRTQGEWTRAALSDSTALIETLKLMSSDPDCKGVAGAISELNMLNQHLQIVQSLSSTKNRIAQLDSQEQELLLQLSNSTDPVVQAEINSDLRSLQVERAGLLGQESANKDMMGSDKVKLLGDIAQLANTSFKQITANQSCLLKNPSVLNTASAVMASVGTAVTAVNPAVGIGLTAGAAFMGETIEGLKNYKTARKIRKLADATTAFEAYRCALETMSDRWCQMEDAEAFLNFKAKQRSNLPNTGLGRAIRLNDREIPVLIEWLNKIKSGVAANNTADGNRKSVVFAREAILRSKEAFGLGLIEEYAPIYESTSVEQRWALLKNIITQLAPPPSPYSSSTDPKNPLYDVKALGYAPFYLAGAADDRNIRDPNTQNYISFDSWKPQIIPTLQEVKYNYTQWLELARVRVNQELTQVLQPDALQTLSSAYDRTGNRWKLSPMDSLKGLIEFLEQNPPHENNVAFTKLFRSTLESLKKIYSITEEAIIVSDLVTSTPIEDIIDVAQLKYGTVVLQARLDMIVRLSVLELLQNSSQEDQVVVAQLLAAERFGETISKISGTDNLAEIKGDIKNAKPMVVSNLNSFADFFGDNINKLLKKLYKEEKEAGKTVSEGLRYKRTQMCFLLLSVDSASEIIKTKYCEGLKFSAIAPGGPETIELTQTTFNKDLKERACLYRDYFRQTKIYENWSK